jgi:hypothetical protein
MLPLYLITYTIVAKSAKINAEMLKQHTVFCVDYAKHLMGLITNKQEPDVSYGLDENSKAYVKIIVSVSFGKDRGSHLEPVSRALGTLMKDQLPDCDVFFEQDIFNF